MNIDSEIGRRCDAVDQAEADRARLWSQLIVSQKSGGNAVLERQYFDVRVPRLKAARAALARYTMHRPP